ncbi:hypothetical protein NSK_007308 [Nannochloropsis salina CCMP1776]|uniref:Uncharacterized protein n=1 Tax=Nannochloropsis salina CCMP1776 TaxID=1027361 RepID=A0A4D9CTJ4_9STRA|nr:hypothetical protein NSK_007308 [Nannochloropsis salina CCMP1776]|eukprot:TFJ81347.1 hypothetical protein NSK_007308 [Nannochloropsis salina CCMP1776]
MDSRNVADLRWLARLFPSALSSIDENQEKHRVLCLIALLQSADPLVGHTATSLLVEARWQAKSGSCKALVLDALWHLPDQDRWAALERKRLTNLLEAYRRIVEEVCCGHGDREQGLEAPNERKATATCRKDKAAGDYVRRVVTQALPTLHEAAVQSFTASVTQDGGLRDEAELPLVWVSRLGSTLLQSYETEGNTGYNDNHDAQEPFTNRKSAYEVEKRKLNKLLASLCQRCWVATEGVAYALESRRHLLELALLLLHSVSASGAENVDALKEECQTVEYLIGLCDAHWHNIEVSECDKQEAREGKPSACSLVRPVRPSDLFVSSMALWTGCVKHVVLGRKRCNGSLPEWEALSLRLLGSPFCRNHVFALTQEGHRRALVSCLAEYDDKLMSVLRDMLLVHWSLSILREAPSEGKRLVDSFLAASEPIALLHTLLDRLPNESAEQLFLEFFLSDETCALEYSLSLAKFMIWQQQERREAWRHGESSSFKKSGVRHKSPEATVRAFLQRLRQRLEDWAAKRLFPFDPAVLVARLRRLEHS